MNFKNNSIKLRLAALVYGVISFGALWVVAYAVTGNILRSFIFLGAVTLAMVASGQSRKLFQAADIIDLMPFMKEFDEEMKKDASK